ncbi:MAG: FAD:protein FMN transferase [Christensenellales bacterium]|jgi:thiamine biosynthesis lipoprotein|nr:FAD:protein FMN transferase [Clostridiales bacterium]
MKKRKVALIFISAILFITLVGCSAYSGEQLVFGTFYSVKLKGTSAASDLKKIHKLLAEIEAQLSTNIDSSDVYKINNSQAGEPIAVSHHTITMFKKALELYEFTDYAFNAAIFPLVRLWKFSPDTFTQTADKIPSPAEIENCLSYCVMGNFALDEANMTITKLHPNAMLDFGGIAKGYAVDKAKELSKNNKDILIDIGGNITTKGGVKRIGLTHPRNTAKLFGVINLKDLSIATSGDYERFYIHNGVRYNHIIAKDGYPTGINNNDIISVSVIGESAMMCDALSTAVMIQGSEWASSVLPDIGYSCIIITKEHYQIIGDIDFESTQSAYQRI